MVSNSVVVSSQSQSHGGAECAEFAGWAMSHKGKASEVTYNPEDGPSAYSNPTAYNRMMAYTEVGRQVYGEQSDPTAQPLDDTVIMRAGGGKKHAWPVPHRPRHCR